MTDRLEQSVMNESRPELEQSGQQAQPQASTSGGDPLDQPTHDATLEEMRQKMIASHTQRQQTVAQKEKELDRLIQQTQMLQQQLQSNGGSSNNGGTDQSRTPTWMDELDPDLRDQLSDPQNQGAARLLQAFEKGIEKKYGSKLSKLDELEKQNLQLAQALKKTRDTGHNERLMQEAPEISQKYGKFLTPEEVHSAIETAKQSGITLEDAILRTNPDAFRQHEREQAAKEANRAFEEKFGASVEGFEDIFGGDAEPHHEPYDTKTGKLRPMRDTAKSTLSPSEWMRAITGR